MRVLARERRVTQLGGVDCHSNVRERHLLGQRGRAARSPLGRARRAGGSLQIASKSQQIFHTAQVISSQ